MKKVVFLTGAGVSAESGVETFRDSGGLWEGHNVMDVASPQGWRRDKQLVLDFYNARRNQLKTVEPNLAHQIIAELELHHNVQVITQNVDDLHERAGTTKIIHLHGELTKMCSSKNKEKTLPYDEDIKVGDKHEDGSQLRPFIVWFGEDVPLLYQATKYVEEADVLVIVGTSINVYPAASLYEMSKDDAEIYYVDPNPNVSGLPFDLQKRIKIIQKVATEGLQEIKQILLQDEGNV
jgi:NAD-dependent deacetylase